MENEGGSGDTLATDLIKTKPLFAAALCGNTDSVRRLLDNGANVDQPMRFGGVEFTPLHAAAIKGCCDVVRLLLERGANLDQPFAFTLDTVNAEASTGRPPILISVAASNQWEVVKILLDTGKLDVNLQYGLITPLSLACKSGNCDAVRLLIERGANVQQVLNDEQRITTALSMAAYEGHTEVVKLLLASGEFSSDARLTALLTATEGKGDAELVKELLGTGICLRTLNIYDPLAPAYISPILSAAQIGKLEVAKLLLDYGLDVNYHGEKRRTPLFLAAQSGRYDVALLLLERGAKVGECDSRGTSPITIAAQHGFCNVVELLLSRGAEFNEHNCYSPMGAAARGGYCDVLTLLLDHGADIEIFDEEGDTPLLIAANGGHVDAMRLLLEKGALVNCKNQHSSTALYYASHQGRINCVKLLLEHGADPNIGESALFTVCNSGKFEIAKILLHAGAKVIDDITFPAINYPYPITALHYAAQHQGPEAVEFAELVIDKGIDLNLASVLNLSEPPTPLEIALKYKCLDLVWLLALHGGDTTTSHENKTVVQQCEGDPKLLKAVYHFWSPERHFMHPQCVKDAIFCLLLIAERQDWILDRPIMFKIFQYVAFDWFHISRKRKLAGKIHKMCGMYYP